MSSPPIHLAFLWHMHQPFYVDPTSGDAMLPWVRLHATAAYSDMACLLARYPRIRATISISPSLVEQIHRYVEGGRDVYERATLVPADQLTADDRLFLVRHFFSISWARAVQPSPRYRELLAKRGRDVAPTRWQEVAASFSPAELRDLQVLFNLAWFGACAAEAPNIASLLDRGRDFSEEDKETVLREQHRIMGDLLPRWSDLVAHGAVEIVATPYHHAILPLLIDTNTARRANPEVSLPSRFSFPDDAATQVTRAVDKLEHTFGRRPVGLWPSEAAISPETVELIQRCGLSYVATDATLLFHSLDDRGSTPGRSRLHQPYRVGDVALLFRDEQLSLRIAAEYPRWEDSSAAAHDFVSHVLEAGDRARMDSDAPPLVVVALDGENPWEAYPRRGHDFLSSLYEILSGHDRIRTVTIGQHLAEHPPPIGLDYLSSGSWVESNFDIWIGDTEKNRAWNLLTRARGKLERERRVAEDGRLEDAREHLLRAECSDWFWWLGEPFSSAEDTTYEGLFREHLLAFYRALGESPPADLSRSIARGEVVAPLRQPTDYINPRIDGSRTSYFEWRGAGFYRVPVAAGNGALALIGGLYWGFDPGRFFLRLDPAEANLDGPHELRELDICIELTAPGRTVVGLLELADSPSVHLTSQGSGEEKQDLGVVSEVALREVVELAIPLSRLGYAAGTKLGMTVTVRRNGASVQEIPPRGVIEVAIPSDDLGY